MMPNSLHILKKRTVYTNIIRIALIFLIICLFISLFLYSNSKQILESELKKSSQTAAESNALQIDNHLTSVSRTAAVLSTNQFVQFYIESPVSSVNLFDGFYSTIASQLETAIYSSESIHSIYVVSMQDNSYIDYTGYHPLDSLKDASWLKLLDEIDFTTGPQFIPREANDIYPFVLTLIRQVGEGNQTGYIVLNMDIKKIPALAGASKTNSSIFFVTDDCQVLYRSMKSSLYEPISSFSELSPFNPESGNMSLVIDDASRPYVYTQLHSNRGDWYYITLTYLDQYLQSLSAQRSVLLAFSMTLLFLFTALAIFVSLNSYRPIQRILDIMDDPRRWLTLDDYSTEEVKQIAEQVARYVQTNTALSEELKSQLNILRDVRLWAMQSQLNPHFIFNTLNLIHIECVRKLGYTNNISSTILTFSKLIQYALYSATYVPFSEEIYHSKLFLEILQKKYLDDFHSELSVSDDCSQLLVPKLLLQPILENTVEHGADFGRKGTLHVLVKANVIEIETDSDNIQKFAKIEVIDDGLGMKPAQLDELRHSITEPGDFKDERIGLRNVVARLRMLYDGETHFEIDSTYGEGTRITIILPTSAL